MNMDYLIDFLAFILPIIAGILLVTSIIVYTKFRRRFPVKTNCWFCNKNTKVPYEIQNSWYCPSCEQYNGFTKDGDYNIDISAHFTSNSPNTSSQHLQEDKIVWHGRSNGLCDACNNNQAIKVQLLADFEPCDERKFDEEIQQFKKRLEQTYCLCTRCEKVLSQTLAKHTSWLLGLKLSHLRSKGLSLLNPTFSNQISIKYVSFVNCILYVVATIQLMVSLFQSDLSQIFPFLSNSDHIFYYFNLNTYLRYFNTILHNNNLLQKIVFDDYSEMYHSFSTLWIHDSISSEYIYLSLACIGILLQMSLFAWHIERKRINIIKIVLWFALHFLKGPYFLQYPNFKALLQISLSVSILILMSLKEKVPSTLSFKKKKKKGQFKEADFCETNHGQLFLSNDLPNNFEFVTKTNENTDCSLDLKNSNHAAKKKRQKGSDLQINRFKQSPVFGGKPEIFNPLKSTGSVQTCDIKHTNKTSNNYEKNNLTISPISDKTIDFSVKHLNALDIGTKKTSPSCKHFCCQEYNGYKSKHIFKIDSVSPVIGYTKPLLSPPRLRNVSQSSWVAGGYWKVSECQQNEQGHVFISRSSSQTSGIESIISEQTINHNFYVPTSAKSNSVDEDDSISLSNCRSIVTDTASQIPIQAVYPILQNELKSSNKKRTFQINRSISPNIPSKKNDEVLHNSLVLNYDRKSKSESPKYCDVSIRNFNSGMSVSSLKGEYSFNSLRKIDSSSGIEKGMLLKKWSSGLMNNNKKD